MEEMSQHNSKPTTGEMLQLQTDRELVFNDRSTILQKVMAYIKSPA